MTDTYDEQAKIAGAAAGLRPEQWPGLAHILRQTAAAEREACAKIATDRAAICQDAYDKGDVREVHPLNEALHIAQLIRNRK